MVLGPIYGITDPELLPGKRLFTGAAAALQGGVRTLQYRDKAASFATRRERASELLRICKDYQAILIINDDPVLALEVGAHGVHLGQDDSPLPAARQTLGDAAIIGVTCHASLALASAAQTAGASYVAFGRFFPSQTKPEASAAPMTLVSEARRVLNLPITVIGGITVDNMAPLVQAGAQSVAVCQSLFGAANIEQAAKALLDHFTNIAQHKNENV